MKTLSLAVFQSSFLLLLGAPVVFAQASVLTSAPLADGAQSQFSAGVPMPSGFPSGSKMTPAEGSAWVAKARVLQDEYYARLLAPLQKVTNATLNSLNPQGDSPKTANQFQNYNILGQLPLVDGQAQAVADAVASSIRMGRRVIAENMIMWAGACMLEPRHGLRVTANGHTYDYLLCFGCSESIIYEDDRIIAEVDIGGRPTVLNNLLIAAKIPVDSLDRMEAVDKDFAKAAVALRAHMPKALQDVWAKHHDLWTGNFLADSRAALVAEFSEVTPRIRALLEYYGAEKSWGPPFDPYQLQAANLLVDYSRDQLAAALSAGPLSDAQMEGTAHWLSTFVADPASLISAEQKAQLLGFVADSDNNDSMKRAFNRPTSATSPPPSSATP